MSKLYTNFRLSYTGPDIPVSEIAMKLRLLSGIFIETSGAQRLEYARDLQNSKCIEIADGLMGHAPYDPTDRVIQAKQLGFTFEYDSVFFETEREIRERHYGELIVDIEDAIEDGGDQTELLKSILCKINDGFFYSAPCG